MSDDPKPGVIGSLPRTRPHRRSDKRPAPAGAPPIDTQAQQTALVQAAASPKARPARKPAAKPRAAKATPAPATPRTAKAKPAATARPAAAKTRAAAPPTPAARPTAPDGAPPAPAPREPSPGVLETAVQAAAELAEIGLHAGARALRGVVTRLPRP